MNETPVTERTTRVRRRVVDMCANPEGGHLGGSLSLTEILVTLYSSVLRIDPRHCDADDRDVLILSKGHGAIGLYAALAEHGFLPQDHIDRYAEPDAPLTAHPHLGIPGVEWPTGALGHGLPVGVGHALGFQLDGSDRRCYVVMGDGELQEGSVWEAAMAAGTHGLDRLVAVIDRNSLQITGSTEANAALEPLAERWAAFGWDVREVDGHDCAALAEALRPAPPGSGRPRVVIARTVKGQGMAQVAGKAHSHYAKLNDRQRQRAHRALAAAAHPKGAQA
ncbi:transketolase [Streptomyces sp. NPDC006552]|uniref:transketolase n=1 Tax=Streptomyces sp. NPDC006552 TaxID=3157179 RepID=UPI0033AB799B